MDNIDKVFKNKLTEEQIKKVQEVSKDLGINPNDLLSVMQIESGISTSIRNQSNGKAAGLIQFYPDSGKTYKTIGGKKYEISDIANMDFITQMDLVKDYISDIKKYNPKADLSSFDELYTAVYYPKALGKGDDYVIAKAGSDNAKHNSGFVDENGNITKGSFKKAAYDRVSKSGITTVNPSESLKKKGDDLKKQNERNYSYEEIADISQRYDRELQDIYAKEGQGLLSPMQVNKAVEDLNQKFYDAGEAGAINQQRKENDKFIKSQQEEYLKVQKEIDNINRASYTEERFKKEEKKLGRKLNQSEKEKIMNDNVSLLEDYHQKRRALSRYKPEYNEDGTVKEVKTSLLNLDNYQSKYIPSSNSSETSSATTGSSTQPDTTYSNLVEGYRGSSQAPGKQTVEEDPNAFLQAFGYVAPPETMTFDTQSSWTDYLGMAGQAAANISMGIAGMKAANEEAPERDEDISEALLNYAAEQKKISQMGLDPAVEADLKMKLNSAYQFGMENIVRASAGNRNLVLGNQGQLDQAKMQGAMQIALMDVERRDRAMQAYGEVLQYINEFDSRKDIANNERKYREFEKRQGAGMALAEKSFSNLISDLEHQWENRKGGPNDLMKRKLLSSIMGYDAFAEDDGSGTKIGTKSWAERIASENREKAEDAKQGRAFFNSLDDEGKKEAYKYLKENSELDPRVNPDARFSGFIDAYQNNYKTKPRVEYDDSGNPFLIMTDEQRDYQVGLEQDATPFSSPLGRQSSFKSQSNPTGQSRFNQNRFGGFDAINGFGLNDKKDPYNLLEQQLFKDVNEEIEQRKAFNRY